MTRMRAAVFAAAATLLAARGCITSNRPAGLTEQEIAELPSGKATGHVSVSANGRLLAYSDGTNIFTLDLKNPTAAPIQITSEPTGTLAFSPSFLSSGNLIYVTADQTNPSQFQLFAAAPGTTLGSPAPSVFGTITATDLGLAADTNLTVPAQVDVNGSGTLGIGTFNGQSYLISFNDGTVTATPLNDVFGQPVSNAVLSPDLSQIAFQNATGQIALVPLQNGAINAAVTTLMGQGTFPSFTPTGELGFFTSSGFNLGTIAKGFTTYSLAAGMSPGFLAYSPTGSNFFSLNSTGTGILEGAFTAATP